MRKADMIRLKVIAHIRCESRGHATVKQCEIPRCHDTLGWFCKLLWKQMNVPGLYGGTKEFDSLGAAIAMILPGETHWRY